MFRPVLVGGDCLTCSQRHGREDHRENRLPFHHDDQRLRLLIAILPMVASVSHIARASGSGFGESDRSGAGRRVGPVAIGCREAADRRAGVGARREDSAGGPGLLPWKGPSFQAEFSKVVTPIWNRMAASQR